MGDLHIAGFEIPVARGGLQHSQGAAGGDGYDITGGPVSATLYETEGFQVTTPLISKAEASAIQSLCRRINGHVWKAEDGVGAASLYSTQGLIISTGTVVTSTLQAKFGTRSFALTFGSIGNVTIATIKTIYTVAAWVKPGAGAWQHEILRSDGAKWVNGIRNDAAVLHLDVSGTSFRILEPASGTDYFDDVTWLPFKIHADWAADWAAATRDFSDLPYLEVSGDLLDGFRVERAIISCRLTDAGYAASFAGDSCTVTLDVTGKARVEDT